MKHKIAVFEYTSTGSMACLAGYQIIVKFPNDENEKQIRVSEWVEIDFPERDKEEIIPAIVKSIDERIEKIKEKAMQEVSELQGKKSELLALTVEK